MAAATVRDVIIRLKIQQQAVELKPPDISPVTSRLKEMESEVNATLNRISSKQATINQRITVTGQQPGSENSFRQPGAVPASPVQPQVVLPQPQVVPVRVVQPQVVPAPPVQPQPVQPKPVQPVQPQVVPPQPASRPNTVATMTQAGEGFRQAGEGVFHLARGFAFLNAKSDEDLEKVIRQIAYYQGLFDIFRGGVDTVKGLSTAHKALSVAQTTSTVTSGVAVTTVGTMAVAMNAATAAANRMWLAISGPIGWLVGGVAVVISGAYAWHRYADGVDDAKASLAKQIEQINAVREAQSKLNDTLRETTRLNDIANNARELRDLDFQNPNVDNKQKDAKLTEAARAARERGAAAILKGTLPDGAGMFKGQPSRKGAFQDPKVGDFPELTKDVGSFIDLLKNSTKPAVARDLIQNRNRGLGGVFTQGTKEKQVKEVERIGDQTKQGMEAEVARQEQILQIGNEQRTLIQERLTALGQEKSALDGIIKQEQERQAAIEAGVKAEKSRGLTDLEKLGRMKPHEQEQLKGIAEKMKRGGPESLRPDEISFIDQTGFSQQKMSRLFINKAIAAGGESTLKDLGSDLITPQEAVSGMGVEGESRMSSLKDARSRSEATERRGGERLDAVLKSIAERRKEEEALVKQLAENTGLRDALKAALVDQGKFNDQLISDIKTLGAAAALANLRQNNIENSVKTGQLTRGL